MKLSLLTKFEPINVQFIWSCVVLDNNDAIMLATDKDYNYFLLVVKQNQLQYYPLENFEVAYKKEGNPVLFSQVNTFGIIKNPQEIILYQNIENKPEIIHIKNKKLFKQVLPDDVRLGYPVPISGSNLLPVCFEQKPFGGDCRYLAFLDINISKKQAQWQSWMQLESKTLPFHRDEKHPPKIDSAMIKQDELFIFTPGGMITSVNKWGMDYYAVVKSSFKGAVSETLLDSGNLHIDSKKRGVNGVFSASEEYAILTPVFQSDEWKGKQKLLWLKNNELLDIEFARGFGKYPKILQHKNDCFWVHLRDTNHIAICKEA